MTTTPRCFLLGALTMAAACYGRVDEADLPPPGPSPPPAAAAAPAPAPAPTPVSAPSGCTASAPAVGASRHRRLTRNEYNNTVRDLLGDRSSPANAFPPDLEVGGFSNDATALTVSNLLAEQYASTAERLATAALARLGSLLPCDPKMVGEDACARQFVEVFGKRAFRRPLGSDEVARKLVVYAAGRSGADFAAGIGAVIRALLQSPHFLYRVEAGLPGPAPAPGVVRLTQHETAARLSYLLWSTMPDDQLVRLADAGQLATAEQVRAQVQRLMADPRAHDMTAQFFRDLLGLRLLDNTSKDAKLFPEFTADVVNAMRAETTTFVDWAVWQADGALATLLAAPVSFVNKALAPIYGVTGVTGTDLRRTDLDPARRAGVLSQPSLMSMYAKSDQTSPVVRGQFVRQKLLCQPPPPPPPDVNNSPPAVKPGVSTRDRFAMHRTDPACAACHRLMDPIGLGFEGLDPIGRVRTMDQGAPVDDTGELLATDDIDGPFRGAVELGKKLAGSKQVSTCMARQWFRFAYGRADSDQDRCSLDRLVGDFTSSKLDMRALIVALTQTDAFSYRKVTP